MKLWFTWGLIALAMTLSAAIFGFFYAWVCSTMWGLDTLDPRVAIAAMQGMNASVRNAIFAPAFFGTPFALMLAGVLVWGQGARGAAVAFGISGLITLFGGVILTMSVNVPMNEALGALTIPEDREAAEQIWADYSPTWQIWNQTRTVLTGIAFVIGLVGVAQFARYASPSSVSAN